MQKLRRIPSFPATLQGPLALAVILLGPVVFTLGMEPEAPVEAPTTSPVESNRTHKAGAGLSVTNRPGVRTISEGLRQASLAAATNAPLLNRFTNEFERALVTDMLRTLDPETQKKLGYDRGAEESNTARAFKLAFERLTNRAVALPLSGPAKPAPRPPGWLASLARIEQKSRTSNAVGLFPGPSLSDKPRALQVFESVTSWTSLLAGLVLYLYVCNCCRNLSWRTGTPARILIWLPLLKRLTFYDAMGISRLWFWLGFIVPFVGLWGWGMCCWRLCGTFGKSKWLTALMVCPFIGWIAFVYLAEATRAEDQEISVQRLRAGYAF